MLPVLHCITIALTTQEEVLLGLSCFCDLFYSLQSQFQLESETPNDNIHEWVINYNVHMAFIKQIKVSFYQTRHATLLTNSYFHSSAKNATVKSKTKSKYRNMEAEISHTHSVDNDSGKRCVLDATYVCSTSLDTKTTQG